VKTPAIFAYQIIRFNTLPPSGEGEKVLFLSISIIEQQIVPKSEKEPENEANHNKLL